MSQMSNYLEVELRKHLFRTGSFTKPTALYVSLHTGSVQEDGSGAEVSAGNYARQNLPPLDANWSAASGTDGITKNLAEIAFPVASVAYGAPVIDFGIWDAESGGNLLCYATLTDPKTVNVGDQLKFPINSLTITFA